MFHQLENEAPIYVNNKGWYWRCIWVPSEHHISTEHVFRWVHVDKLNRAR